MVNPTLTMPSLTRCTPAKPAGKLGLTRMENTDIVSMIDNGVTNLSGKTLSKLIHYFLVMLIKVPSFLLNMLCFLKIMSIYVPIIFRMKYGLLNMLDLIKLYTIW